jgi:hypothetical protein
VDAPAGCATDAGYQAQGGGLARTVATHQADRLAASKTQAQIAHCPHVLTLVAVAQDIEQHTTRTAPLAQEIPLPDTVEFDQDLR